MKELLTPNQVARALGVSEASLKRWCDKGLLQASRTVGGHRRLTVGGVMDFLRSSGHELVRPEVLGLPPATGKSEAAIDRVGTLVRAALEAGDQERLRRLIINLYLAGHTICEIGDRVIAPSFIEIGERWSHGDVEVYEERRGVEICLRVLHEMRTMLTPPLTDAPLEIGETLQGDPYSLPGTLVELTLAELGWRAQFYGVDHPAATLEAAIREIKPRLFCLSISALHDEDDFVAMYDTLFTTATACNVPIAVGGRGITHGIRERIRYAAHCDTLAQLADFARALYVRPSTAS